MALGIMHQDLQSYLQVVDWEERYITLADRMVVSVPDDPRIVNDLRSLVQAMRERISSLKGKFDTSCESREQLTTGNPVPAVPPAVEPQDSEAIRALRIGLIAASNTLLAQGGPAAAEHLAVTGPGGVNGPHAQDIDMIRSIRALVTALNTMVGRGGLPVAVQGLDIEALRDLLAQANRLLDLTGPGGAQGPVAAQNLNIQDIGGLLDALKNMLGRPVAVGNRQVPAVWGLDGAAL